MFDLVKALSKIKPVSSFRSRKEWEAATWDKLLFIIRESKSKKDLSSLLVILVSVPERQDIVMRAAAIARILDGASYRNIGKELWLSPQTISAIRKGLKEQKYISRWKRDGHQDRERKQKKNQERIAKREAREAKFRPSRRTKYGRVYY